MSPSADQSHLDRKYFIDHRTYNCPFCNRRHVSCRVTAADRFDWSNSKACYVYLVKCESCGKESMHLSYALLTEFLGSWGHQSDVAFKRGIDLDALIFYSVPTSFFVMDDRIPAIIRELITEAEGCRKMNFLTGASACARKTIYEFLVEQKAEGDSYEDRIKSLKARYPSVDPLNFDVLAHIKDMTSEKVHEQSWDRWDSQHLTLIEALKVILYEIHVLPKQRSEQTGRIQQLLERVMHKKSSETPPEQTS